MQDHSLLWLDFRGIFFETGLPHRVYLNHLLLRGSIHTAHVYSGVDVEKEENYIEERSKNMYAIL